MAENDLPSPLSFNTSSSKTDIKISTLTVVVAAIFCFLTVIFVFLLYLYAKYHWGSRSTPRRAHFIFPAGNPSLPNPGLDPTILRSIPITLYKPSDFKHGLECAVCLSELTAGEEARLLPKCGHGFHLQCIDTWLQSHSTCPICRRSVGPEAVEDHEHRSDESPDLPADVLFWGNRNQISTRRVVSEEENSGSSGSSERVLVISIPNRSAEGFISLPSIRSELEDMKSPVTPKRWPLRRTIFSMGKKTGGSSCSSPRVGDVEQGLEVSGAENGEGSSGNSSASSL
ncbi:RING-H2 finger protein ATL3-like [Phalaenopsis equestris]|uniref:RING-H2 finger protein ATL3-like n=1 Tax=Phalaenopsis equestris TaxID=78828 RepID=UPI0009E5A8BB|nr:RING-H2 finger protein ATL3-like [Phalaenopsis equestris]